VVTKLADGTASQVIEEQVELQVIKYLVQVQENGLESDFGPRLESYNSGSSSVLQRSPGQFHLRRTSKLGEGGHRWKYTYTAAAVWLIAALTASAPNLTTPTRQNRGRGIKVQFHGVNIGQTTAGKVSKQKESWFRTLVARQEHTQQYKLARVCKSTHRPVTQIETRLS